MGDSLIVKQPQHEVYYLPTTNAEAKNAWIYTFTSPFSQPNAELNTGTIFLQWFFHSD
jgi:hypothetical protein